MAVIPDSGGAIFCEAARPGPKTAKKNNSANAAAPLVCGQPGVRTEPRGPRDKPVIRRKKQLRTIFTEVANRVQALWHGTDSTVSLGETPCWQGLLYSRPDGV